MLGQRSLNGVSLVLAGLVPAAAAPSEPGLLQQRGGPILLVAVALVLQAAAIVALMVQNRRTRRAERAARAQLTQIAQLNRLAAAGELSASIAHEINQPLAAIVANATRRCAGSRDATPDIERGARRARAHRRRGHRASDVIGGIRAMFKRDGEPRAPIDVNAADPRGARAPARRRSQPGASRSRPICRRAARRGRPTAPSCSRCCSTSSSTRPRRWARSPTAPACCASPRGRTSPTAC